MAEFSIRIEPNKLSDGSEVFNVVIAGEPHAGEIARLSIGAVSEKDANEMADRIAEAINDHSIDTASVHSW